MTDEPSHTRREVQALTPALLRQYHDLLMANDLAGLEELFEVNRVAEELRVDLRRDFTLYAERILRRKWRGPKFP
jgi:hypothetical protein